MKVAVLCGGVSPERDVSLNSGAAVEVGLRGAVYETALVDVKSIAELMDGWDALGADVAFIALHGGWGEDGRIQAALASRGVPYTGSRTRSCALCMDKDACRREMESGHIPVPPGIALSPSDDCDFSRLLEDWKKIVVKPASCGSTVGLAITDDASEALSALNAVWDVDTKAVIEKFIPGRELTVTVFGSGDAAFALPIIEVRPKSGFYDYKSKYTKGATEYICPAELNAVAAWSAAEYARRAHVLMGCRTYSRVDMRFTDEGSGFFVLEVNTAPGMTDTSLVPKSAKAHGWTFSQLLDKIVKDALKS